MFSSLRGGRVYSGATVIPFDHTNTCHASSTSPTDRARSSHFEWSLPGIFETARVATDFGNVPASLLRAGDRVKTRSNGMTEILSIDAFCLERDFLERHSSAMPVLIAESSLGPRVPSSDVLLSPAQPILASSDAVDGELIHARRCGEKSPFLSPAPDHLTYYMIDLGEAAMISCEGIWISV